MSVPILRRMVDERFLNHRQRSTSLAGIVSGMLAALLFAYRAWFNHVWSWDLLAVALTFVAVKMGAMVWFRLRD